jgi:formyl-CoA transferase
VEEAIAARTLAENEALIEAAGLTAIAVGTIAEIEDSPQWRARNLTFDLHDDDGTIRMHQPVPRLSATPAQIRHGGRPVGADNVTIYRDELGLSETELAQLRAAGVI